MCGFRGGLELLLEKSTKVHKVDFQPKDDEGKVLLDRIPQGRLPTTFAVWLL
jgi:hypothetical protein